MMVMRLAACVGDYDDDDEDDNNKFLHRIFFQQQIWRKINYLRLLPSYQSFTDMTFADDFSAWNTAGLAEAYAPGPTWKHC